MKDTKQRLDLMVDAETKKVVQDYAKALGKTVTEVVSNLINNNCKNFSSYNNSIFGSYGNDVSYLRNFDYTLFSSMSKEEIASLLVHRILDDMKYAILKAISPKCINVDYGLNIKSLYFNNKDIQYREILSMIFSEKLVTFTDIVNVMFGQDSNEAYIVRIYNKFLSDNECFNHLYDYGVYVDDFTKKCSNNTYFTRIGHLLDILKYQGHKADFENDEDSDYLEAVDALNI